MRMPDAAERRAGHDSVPAGCGVQTALLVLFLAAFLFACAVMLPRLAA